MAPPTHLDGSLLVTVQSWCFGGSKLMAWLIFGYVSSPTMHEMPSSPAKANARGTTCLLLILLLVGYVRFTADSKAGAWLGGVWVVGRSRRPPRTGAALPHRSNLHGCVFLSLSLSLSLSLFPLPASPRSLYDSDARFKKIKNKRKRRDRSGSGRSKTSRTATSGARRSIEGKECLRREVHHGTHLDGEPEPGALAAEGLRA